MNYSVALFLLCQGQLNNKVCITAERNRKLRDNIIKHNSNYYHVRIRIFFLCNTLRGGIAGNITAKTLTFRIFLELNQLLIRPLLLLRDLPYFSRVNRQLNRIQISATVENIHVDLNFSEGPHFTRAKHSMNWFSVHSPFCLWRTISLYFGASNSHNVNSLLLARVISTTWRFDLLWITSDLYF